MSIPGVPDEFADDPRAGGSGNRYDSGSTSPDSDSREDSPVGGGQIPGVPDEFDSDPSAGGGGATGSPSGSSDNFAGANVATSLSRQINREVNKFKNDAGTTVFRVNGVNFVGASGRSEIVDIAESAERSFPDPETPDPDSGGTSVADSDRYGSSSPIGSGNVDIGIDPETGRATIGIGGQGSGTATRTPTQEETIPVASVPSMFVGGEGSVLNRVEQRVEDATGGTAFGDPGSVEDIGTGEAIREIPDNESIREFVAENRDSLNLLGTVLGVVTGAATVWALLRDGE